jgi:hypothetical protein
MPVHAPISSKPSAFRELAEEAMDWARTARSEHEREIFLQIARTWLQAALVQDRKLEMSEP